jgi:Protein of unknown function (DUF4050)
MITIQLSSEVLRFTLLIGILIFHKSAYKLISRIMDRLTSTSSRSTTNSGTKSPSSENHPTSPRLSSFHRRFRSSTSNSASDNTNAQDPTDSGLPTKSEAARSAKRFLLSTVRDDWNYPASASPAAHDLPHREPVDYRIREDGSSDPEPLSDEPYDARDPMVFTDSDPYKFENPDAVARTISDRKRKRRRMFEEELQWNEGLRTWDDCRNAWCGAVKHRPRKRRGRRDDLQENRHKLSAATDVSISLSPHSQLSATSSPVDSTPDSESDCEMEESDDNQDLLLPVYPSMLPEDNLIRASIKPTMYPAIYSKVVLQSLTPTVPVPLPDIIGALVQGWKSEGNWPPRGVMPTTSIIQEGGRRASELLKFRRRESAVAEKGRMRKGVGAVKKALGLKSSNGEANGAGFHFEDEESKRNGSIDGCGLVEDHPSPS